MDVFYELIGGNRFKIILKEEFSGKEWNVPSKMLEEVFEFI